MSINSVASNSTAATQASRAAPTVNMSGQAIGKTLQTTA